MIFFVHWLASLSPPFGDGDIFPPIPFNMGLFCHPAAHALTSEHFAGRWPWHRRQFHFCTPWGIYHATKISEVKSLKVLIFPKNRPKWSLFSLKPFACCWNHHTYSSLTSFRRHWAGAQRHRAAYKVFSSSTLEEQEGWINPKPQMNTLSNKIKFKSVLQKNKKTCIIKVVRSRKFRILVWNLSVEKYWSEISNFLNL